MFLGLNAQTIRDEMRRNPNLTGTNYYAYPGPTQAHLTPAPAGYKPFYISHYGRHGSRYLIGKYAYNRPYSVLLKADSLGKLTPKGQETLKKVAMLRQEAMGRDGELTLLGAQQHKEIARRMYQNFPEVFADSANIDAKSTIVIRCILSMENALQELLTLNPKLKIRHDASYHDMYYMNFSDKKLTSQAWNEPAKKAYDEFLKRHRKYEDQMNLLFNDADYWRNEIDPGQLHYDLYELASNVQSTELRHSLSLYDIFTEDELYNEWLVANAYWYVWMGHYTLNGGKQPFTQRNLLRKIIAEADSCLALEHPGATLRYGHDTMVTPLTCLLDLNGYGQAVADLEQLERIGWYNVRITPMATNLQFIFYRRAVDDKDVIFKVLENENEATLPLKTDIAPYYHWADFKAHYTKVLDAFSY